MSLFSLDENSGILRTAKKIDREKYCPGMVVCTLKLDVSAGQGNILEIWTLEIDILDENDNSPQFEQTQLDISISESSPTGSKRKLPEATDLDSPDNGVDPEAYGLQASVQGIFKLTLDTDGLFLELMQPLDREKIDQYSLKLLSYDKGRPSRSATMDIRITVSDSNDNSPIFEKPVYKSQISEDFSLNTPIIALKATDKDIGDNAKITYNLGVLTNVNYGNIFEVDVNSGELYLKSKLDFEKKSDYLLEVIAKDGGTNSNTAICNVEITVTDVNDNSPQVRF
jgi:hypothetical protein